MSATIRGVYLRAPCYRKDNAGYAVNLSVASEIHGAGQWRNVSFSENPEGN